MPSLTSQAGQHSKGDRCGQSHQHRGGGLGWPHLWAGLQASMDPATFLTRWLHHPPREGSSICCGAGCGRLRGEPTTTREGWGRGLLSPLISTPEVTPTGDLAAWQPQAWLMEAGGISIQNLFREDVPWNWKHVIMSPTVPGCHSLITLLSLEHSPFVGLGGLSISPCATGHSGQSWCPWGCAGAPASLTFPAPSQLASSACLAAGLPALAPLTSQPLIPDPSPGCCPSLWAALLSLPRTCALLLEGGKEDERWAPLLVKCGSL